MKFEFVWSKAQLITQKRILNQYNYLYINQWVLFCVKKNRSNAHASKAALKTSEESLGLNLNILPVMALKV